MQSARVWQTQFRKGGVAPPEELPTIDYDLVRNSMRQMGVNPAPRRSEIDPAGIGNLVREAMTPVRPDYRPSASQWLPGGGPQRRLKFASEEPVESSVCGTCGIPHPCHHDVQAAMDAGDVNAVQAMNEIRNMRRMAFVQAQEQAVTAAEGAFVKEASARQERRTAVSQILDEMENDLTVEAKDDKCKCADGCKCPDGECKCKSGCVCASAAGDGFKPVSALNPAERERLIKWANKNGWDAEYAEKFFSPVDDGIPEAVKKIAATSLDEASKKSIVVAMFKESKLTGEQANRIKEYWRDELQYQDTDWVNDLVADPDK
jgi:hypothetical protein